MNRDTVTKEELLRQIDSKNDLIESIYNLLEVVTQTNDLSLIYNKILETAIHTIKNANYGSILVRDEDGYYKFVCLIGFNMDKFKDMKLNVEETSIYRETDGLMNRTCIVNEIFKYNKNIFNNEISTEIEIASDVDVKTTIIAPIKFGDEYIKKFAEIADSVVSKYGTFSRFGGDEFNIFVPSNIEDIFEEINHELVTSEKISDYKISYSCGIANYPSDGKDYDELFKVADSRMYEEKNAKKNIS